MYELHITPKSEFKEIFIDIAKRYKLKIISHDNLDISGNFLYSEIMLAEKCKDLHELNSKIELINSVARQHNLLRTKIETEISSDFKFKAPYKLGSTYHEFHIDVKISRVTKELSNICRTYDLVVSKNPEKDTFMLTFRSNDLVIFKLNYLAVMDTLKEYDFNIVRDIKEFCFCDDNLGVDSPWLNTYKGLK